MSSITALSGTKSDSPKLVIFNAGILKGSFFGIYFTYISGYSSTLDLTSSTTVYFIGYYLISSDLSYVRSDSPSPVIFNFFIPNGNFFSGGL